MAKPEGSEQTRRAFVKTVAYVAPAILTLKAMPARAQQASGQLPTEAQKLEWLAEQNGHGGEDHHHEE